MSWAYAWAVQAGLGKAEAQDFATLQVHGDFIALAVSDGAGSAANAGTGSKIAAMGFCAGAARLAEALSGAASLSGRGLALESAPADHGQAARATAGSEWARWVLSHIREEIEKVAIHQEQPFATYAATLVGAVAGPDWTLFVQVGDGAGAFTQDGMRQIAIVAEEAEFLNTTYFVTDSEAETHLQVRSVEGLVDEIALFTDGLSGFVLHPGTNEPHDRFFETVFRNVRAPEGQDEAASAWLASMLQSEFVTNRTDDDTSIVVVRR